MESWKFSNFLRKPSLNVALLQNDRNGLKRVLGPLDLIGYGLGSTVGAGIFVVYGVVANSIAGPAVVFSFLFAAFSSFLSALCYAGMFVTSSFDVLRLSSHALQ